MVYSPEMVALLQQLRSRIFAEFGTRIRLADPELLNAVGLLGKKSRDPFTRKTVVEIMKLGGVPFDLEYSAKTPSPAVVEDPNQVEITYRGIKVLRNKLPESAPTLADGPVVDRQSKHTYRGQLVYK